MSLTITAGATDVTVPVYFVDDDGGTAPGEPTTGLLFSNIETGGSASYQRQGAARVDFTLVTVAVAAAHTDGGFILIDDTNMPGLYRLDVPDAAFATGVDYVVIHLVAAAANNSIIRPLMVQLTAFDLQNTTPTVNVTEFAGTTVPAPNTAGIPDVNVQEILDVAVTLTGNDLDVHVAAVLSAAADTIARKVMPQSNTAYNDIQALMVDDTDHVTPETGLSLTVTRAINSGSFGAATGTVTEMSLGFYQFDASAADMNGAVITFRFVGTGADDTFLTLRTAA